MSSSFNSQRARHAIALMGTTSILAVLGILFATSMVAAQSYAVGFITLIRTGWNDDAFAVVTDQPTPNPARCPNAAGAVSTSSLPGYSTYYAAALTAFAARKRVHVVVHDTECVAGWPKLIGVNLVAD